MVRKLVWLAVFCVPALAQAQSVQIVQGDHAGSGSVVWRYTNYPNYGQILTCWHVINSKDPVGVIWKKPDGTRVPSEARVLAFDKEEDIALLEAYIDATPAVVVAPTTPPIGSKVFICGFGENIYTERAATIQAIEDGYIRLDRAARFGDSGGALTFDGKIVGINVMHRREDYDGLAVTAEKIRRFLTHQAGWKFDTRSLGLPPQESQPPPQQPQPQPAPSQKSKRQGPSVARVPVPVEAPVSQTPAEERRPQPAAQSPLRPAAAGQPVAQPAGAAAGKLPVPGNQQPANPQIILENRDRHAATARPTAPRFNLATILMISTTGVSVTVCVAAIVLMKRGRKQTDQDADADDDRRDRKTASRKTGGFQSDDEWFNFWFKKPGAPRPPSDLQQRPPGKSRRTPPPATDQRSAPPKNTKRPD